MNSVIRSKTWIQIFLWGGFWILIPIILSGNPDMSPRYWIHSIFVFIGVALTIIINLEILLPRLYIQKKQIAYFISGVLLIILIALATDYVENPFYEMLGYERGERPKTRTNRGGFSRMKYLRVSIPFLISFIGSSLFEISAFARKKENEAIQYQKEKLETEIKFLKSQINPHFLFNTLNNIYTLTLLKTDLASEHLLKLSGMLRYMLYDCNEDFVPLRKEIEYIRNYVSLHMLKDSKGLNIHLNLDESRPEVLIAPMLFIPLIENAFKHGNFEDREKGHISISLESSESEIILKVKNSVPIESKPKLEERGIGLENIKRQLELMYPEKHSLKLNEDGQFYTAMLKIIYK